jgi:hypothetical protein
VNIVNFVYIPASLYIAVLIANEEKAKNNMILFHCKRDFDVIYASDVTSVAFKYMYILK